MTHCSKCQAENEDSAKFCVKCGAELNASKSAEAATSATPAATTTTVATGKPAETTASTKETSAVSTATAAGAVSASAENSTNAATAEAPKPAAKTQNFFAFIIAVMMKPVTALKEEIAKYSDIKNAAIITVISAVFGMICSLLTAMVGAVVVKKCSLFGGTCKTSMEWDNLGDLDWLGLTLVNFIAYALGIALLAGIFFGLSRAFKQKQTNFCRMMAIFAVAMIPMFLAAFVGGLVGLLNSSLGMLVVAAGSVYGFYIFYEGVNNEAGITGDKKVYYNFLSILAVLVILVILTLILNESGAGVNAGTKMLDINSLF